MPSPDLPQRRPSSGLSGGGRFDLHAIANALPATAATLLVDTYLSDRETASVRVFRVYRPTPPHYHETCDEVLYCLSGRGTFWIGDPGQEAAFGPGQLLLFDRRTLHALPTILEEPLVFLSVDTPRREPTDIVFVDPQDGTPATFMARNAAKEPERDADGGTA
ncbi:cupin domain-containing protein [Methylorubrum populi]